ncbi:hypothetical protein HID58_057024, partial [Brassica napus]
DVSGSEDIGRDQGDTATGSERGNADESDCRPTIYHPGGIFEELAPLPPGLLRDPRAQSWGNVFGSSASHHTSRLPCVLGPRKSRLPLFTRKQQRLLDKAREMDGVPDLSALLKGKLQLLTKKSTTVDPQGPSNSGIDVTSEGGGNSREGASKEGVSREEGPTAIDQGGRAETSASGPKKKKKTKRTKVGATDEVPPEESASVDVISEGSKAKKKKDGRKRSRGGAASSADRGEGLAEGQEAVLVGAASYGHPKKRTKRSVAAEPRPSTSDANAGDATLVDAVGEASGTPENLSEERGKTCSREGGSGGEPARSTPDSSARKRSGSEGSVAKRRMIEFPDRVEFSYNETTPLILNPLRCAELTRQIRGDAAIGRPLLKNEYIDAASSRARNENLEEVFGKDNLETGNTPVREEETENVGIEDPVLVSDSSSEGREDEEEEDEVEETSPSQPVEEETTNKVGNRDVPPPPVVASLVPIPTQVEDPTAAATEDPVGPSALGTPEENISQIFEYRCVIVLIVRRQGLLREYDLNASAVSWLLFVG